MPRKITSGRVGAQVLGSIVTEDNAFQSVVANSNIVLEPNGTGIVESTSTLRINNQNALRLMESTGGGTNYVDIKAPATVATNVTLTLPADDGNSGQVLRTDGSGVLSWVTQSLTVTNRTAADSNTYYLAMTDVTTGSETELSVANGTRLEFVPNPGLLKVNSVAVQSNTASTTTGSGALTIAGGCGVGGQLTAASIVETSSIALKTNIAPINNALDSVLQLTGVTYDRIDTKEHESGLIAEWVGDILPDLVTRDEEGNTVGIKYTKLTAYLIEAVKSLSKQIEELKK